MKNEKELKQIKEILTKYRKTLSTVESCTGGKIASSITSVSESSLFFKGGIVPYSSVIKNKVLGVKQETLDKYGAVSIETAKEMLLQGIKLFDVDFCIATTGFAGPSGGNDKYPLGTIIIAYGSKDKNFIKVLSLNKNRDDNIEEARFKAITLFNDYLKKYL